jgi:hypothetical protein
MNRGTDFEHAIVEIGHYPEERSGNKGVEPESVTFDTFGGTPYVFVGAERSFGCRRLQHR